MKSTEQRTDRCNELSLPQKIALVYKTDLNPVCICFAADNRYAPYLMVTLYSLLINAAKERCYDILIMTKDISEENREKIQQLSKFQEHASIRFLDMRTLDSAVNINIGKYYSAETNYRLYLMSENFQAYKRMIYLDSDLIILKDISKLYDTDMKGHPVAAVTDAIFEMMYQIKNPIFYQNEPYNAFSYIKTVIGLERFNQYFNAGVLLLNLEQLQKLSNERRAIQILREHEFTYNDQDTLNYIVKGNYIPLDIGWNYQNCYENVRRYAKDSMKEQFQWMYRDHPEIIHYVSAKKPWNTNKVTLDEIYHEYEQRLTCVRKETRK